MFPLIPIIALLVLLGLGIYFIQKSRSLKKPETKIREPKPQQTQALATLADLIPPVPSAPKASRLSKALKSWLPLLQSNSKDRNQWEEVLIGSDLGPKLADEILAEMQASELEPKIFLKQKLLSLIAGAEAKATSWERHKPCVIFVVGVNGVGKTTTVVKLANFFKAQGKQVGAVAADTFRKAAIEQLERGCQRLGVDFFSMSGAAGAEGADPSAVVFDGLKKFANHDVVLVDTSGRLHNKKNLMEELKKMKRVAEKSLPGAPHEVWLVVDSTLGQNSVLQGRSFSEAVQLTGMLLTKLDGLSRGGGVFQIYQELQIPIYFVGLGEKESDLEPFKAENFIEELFEPA